MSKVASMWVYPWDLLDDGPEQVVTRARSMGLTDLSFTAVYHAGRVVLPHNRRRRFWFPEDGAAYFQPTVQRYGPLCPPRSRLVEGQDLLGEAIAAARQAGLGVAFWVVCLHNGALGQAHPECTTENAFGDRLFNCLCPANEHVRQYLVALLTDLAARYGPDAMDLESVAYLPWDPPFQIEIANVPLSPLAKFLLSLCFCPACLTEGRQQGVDGSTLRGWVRQTTDLALAGLEAEVEAELWATLPQQMDGAMGAWFAMRERVVTAMYDQIGAALGATGPALRAILFAPPSDLWQTGVNPQALAPLVRSAIVNCYTSSPADALRRWQEYAAATSPSWQRLCGLRVGADWLKAPAEVEAAVVGLAQAGADGYCFYNYGIMTETQLGWVRQAVVAGAGA